MTSFRYTLLDLLARLFQRWAVALNARLEPAHAPPEAPHRPADDWLAEDGPPPPDHWREAARVQPPQHWLDVVSVYAPQLLEADSDGVIDWAADETADAATTGDAQPENATVVWDERPLMPPAHPKTRHAPAHERALPLLAVSTSIPAVRQRLHEVEPSLPGARQAVRKVVSKTGRAARLRFGGSPHPQPLSLRAQGAKRAGEGDSPQLAKITQQNHAVNSVWNGEGPEKRWSASVTSGSPRPAVSGRFAEGLGVRTVRPHFHHKFSKGRGVKAKPRLAIHQIRSTLAEASSPPKAGYSVSAPPPLHAVRASTTIPAEVNISGPRFPALLDDPHEPVHVDHREVERRQRLDAEQEGRTWNG